MASTEAYSIPPVGYVSSKDEAHPLYASTGGRVPLEEGTPVSSRYSALRENAPAQQAAAASSTTQYFDFDGVLDDDAAQPYGESCVL